MKINKQKKILFIVQLPPPVHGAAVMNSTVVTAAQKHMGFNVKIIPLQMAVSQGDVGKFKFRKILKAISVFVTLFKNCIMHRPDLAYYGLIPHGIAFYRDLPLIFLLKLFKINHVFHIHRKGADYKTNGFIRKLLLHWTFKDAKVIHLSPLLYPDISKYIAEDHCFFLPNGIDDPFVRNVPSSNGDEALSPPRILFLSNMNAAKGTLVLLEALIKLKKEGCKFQADFAGEFGKDDIQSKFKNLVKKYQMESCVTYHGPVYGKEKQTLFFNADFFVFPTLDDAFPLVVLEAMAHGLPVISSIEGAIPEIIEDNVSGFLAPKNDIEMIARRMKQLLEDEPLRSQMGTNGRRRFLENFTRDIFEKRLIDILNSCLKSFMQ